MGALRYRDAASLAEQGEIREALRIYAELLEDPVLIILCGQTYTMT